VLVAAGLVMSAIHTAHEATWFNGLQEKAVSLSWLVRPGTVTSSLVTGVLGIQPQPTVGEAAAWLLYAVPMLVFVLWPAGRRPRLAAKVAVSALCLLALTACGSTSKAGQALKVTLTDAGCSPRRLTAKSGPITFNVENGGTGKVSELELKTPGGLILGERENIVGGITGSFSLVLQPSRYILSCPSGDQDDNAVLVVTGKTTPVSTADAKLVAAPTSAYKRYATREAGELLGKTKAFVAALRRGDVEQAKAFYGPTRFHYEAIEPVAESFGSLDPEIDARENDVEKLEDWTGFHRIEKILWVDGTTAGTEKFATKLLADVKTLDACGRSTSRRRSSRTMRRTPERGRRLEDHRRGGPLLAHRPLRLRGLGYVLYSALTPADRRALAQQIYALAEPLSTVAAKVST
jgi:iron uptake system EfeUOB component EfeO/EfeM